MGGKKKLILLITALVLLIFFIVPMGIAYFMYKDIFSERYTTASHMKRQIEEFKGLKLKQYFFTSNKGQKLTAYKYYKEDSNYKGLIIIAHGLGGGGHNSYMDVADYLKKNLDKKRFFELDKKLMDKIVTFYDEN
ncbi:hypothetical protein [Treponema sp. OMZ 799]|uniref:hypothetical protein n=1 Tax=Treponema sp. OMZ 799 TaxID=2563668 RepID=UPI0020A47729|nr:hypothetical protein [Treponema sp. OMZ 799]